MTIKEVEQYLEVPRATVRFYEKEGLINPQRGANGYREYSEEDVVRLRKIIVFRKLGMSITDIDDVLDGAKSLSEAVAENISNLERQIEELKGALLVCRRMQEEQEKIETFEVDKYWKVIEEEEEKGNHFLDIAKDMVHFEKSIILEYFGIADAEGNLSDEMPKMIIKVSLVTVAFVVTYCLLRRDWSPQNILSAVQSFLLILLIEVVAGIPIFIVGRKHPEILKNRNKAMFWTLLGLFVILVLILGLMNVFA